jgi:hypothetical protein
MDTATGLPGGGDEETPMDVSSQFSVNPAASLPPGVSYSFKPAVTLLASQTPKTSDLTHPPNRSELLLLFLHEPRATI